MLDSRDLLMHGKWQALSKAQRGCLVELWMWIDSQEADGKVPEHIPRVLGIKTAEIERLTEVGWLERNGAGWTAHAWHQHNPPQDPLEREKWFRRRRQRKGGVDGKDDA